MSKRILSVVALICLLGAGGCASDKKPPRQGPAERAMRSAKSSAGLLLQSFDSNRDGVVSQAELDTGLRSAFSDADTNHDNYISPLEFEAFSQARLGGKSAPPFRLDFDRNVDGHITPEEFGAELRAIAKNLDSDADGILTREELSKASGGKPDDGPGPGDRPHRSGPRHPDGAPPL